MAASINFDLGFMDVAVVYVHGPLGIWINTTSVSQNGMAKDTSHSNISIYVIYVICAFVFYMFLEVAKS